VWFRERAWAAREIIEAFTLLLSGLHTANLSWHTRVGKLQSWQARSFTRETCIKSQHTVVCNMADLVQWHSSRTVEQKKSREETESKKGLDETQFVC